MRDINLPLRKAYISALDGIEYNSVPVPVWYGEAPPSETANNYIVIGGIDNNDTSTKYKADTSTTMRVKIHTHNEVMNDGDAADVIAGEVLSRICPADKTQLDLSVDEVQIISTEVSGDFLEDYQVEGARKYIDRVLTFRHLIFQQ